MKTERSLEDIKAHRHQVLPDAEKYRITHCSLDADFVTGITSFLLTLMHQESGSVRKFRFMNVSISEPTLAALKDASGLYLIDTHYLGWSESQRVEVGDWDGGPPLFWAQTVEEIDDK